MNSYTGYLSDGSVSHASDMSNKPSYKEKFEQLPSDVQKRLLAELKNFNSLLQGTSERLEWRKWRIWYKDREKLNGIDWMYVYAQTPSQAGEFARGVRHSNLDILSIEEVP